ncbi:MULTISPECIES: DUF1934 domain-containing protein [Clostridium]|uniref:DUF1934 domain-containing protein n=1 Tax=Clostridium cibarium TaxID=2762247 RepID=A0ABR8PWS5_9CLOT|nr:MULTISPECIES: DUF1934 domain-containing protein [Clostridium]MBD7912632.1 DUF1934 domain-containing protein [Clostridium cibarium]
MDKKAIISIISNASMDDGDVIEVVSPGKYIKLDNGYKAVYEETEISGMDGTTTTLTIQDKEVILEREGTTTTKMQFNKAEPSVSMYQTPYGMLEISINTKELTVDMNEDGGELKIDYSLGVAGQLPLDTSLSLKIRTQ